MPVEFNWHDDAQTIARLDLKGNPTWIEFHAAADQAIEEMRKKAFRTDIIIYSNSGLPPGNPMPQIKWFAQKLAKLPRFGKIVSVTPTSPNAFMKLVIPIVYRTYGIDTRIIGDFATSLEQAEAFIAKTRTDQATV